MSTERGPEMSDLVFISFPTEEKAEEVRQKVLELQKEYLIELEDAVVVVKTPDGKIKLNQLMNTTAAGALAGAPVGNRGRDALLDADSGDRPWRGLGCAGGEAVRCRDR